MKGTIDASQLAIAALPGTTERGIASVISHGVGIAYHTAHGVLQLQLIHPTLQCLHLVLVDCIENFLGIDQAVILDAIDCPLCCATAISNL